MNNWFYCFTQASLLASIKQLTRTFQLASLGQLTIKRSTSRVSGPGSLVILENHRALKHAFVYCKPICSTSCSSTLKTKMKPEYEESKLSQCDIVRKKSPGTVLLLFIAAIAKLQLHIKLQWFGSMENHRALNHVFVYCIFIYNSPPPSNAQNIKAMGNTFSEMVLYNLITVCSYNTNAVVRNRKLQQVPVVWFFGRSPGTKSRFHLLRIHAHVKIKLAYEESNCNHGHFVVKNHRAQFGCCLQLQQQRCAAQSSCRAMDDTWFRSQWFGSLENHRALNHVFVYCTFISNSPLYARNNKRNDENFYVNTSNLANVRSCNSNVMLQNLTRSWWFGSFTKSPDTKTHSGNFVFVKSPDTKTRIRLLQIHLELWKGKESQTSKSRKQSTNHALVSGHLVIFAKSPVTKTCIRRLQIHLELWKGTNLGNITGLEQVASTFDNMYSIGSSNRRPF
ncbi:hypothetical protein T12_12257 [Trichinella patagoniensis]|uniref:Uncharacterized protein n=1 Tax=Trichinella patagoniensis TaxID=990121 RepID=A0A0V0Z9Q0_9BILA|nr:hypothetical protein T12_12257 [Trichinella patagoniensis]